MILLFQWNKGKGNQLRISIKNDVLEVGGEKEVYGIVIWVSSPKSSMFAGQHCNPFNISGHEFK